MPGNENCILGAKNEEAIMTLKKETADLYSKHNHIISLALANLGGVIVTLIMVIGTLIVLILKM